ncbi:MAG TPA: hypothetical protein VM715_16965 [Candidatus Acidoferrum sp.]|jgi:hypothetical protein|nr:hypothetical protein [Candidatus Acidoferrum sp.]
MSYSVKVSYPNLAKGQQVLINGLGTFENGSTASVSDEEAETYRAYRAAAGLGNVTLSEAFRNNDNVSVTPTKAQPRSGTVSDLPPAGEGTVSDESKVEEEK